jgi:hypothetical protein
MARLPQCFLVPLPITAVYCCNATQRRMSNEPLVQSLCCSCLPWEFGHTRDNAAPKYRVLFESPRLAAGKCKPWGEAVPSHMLNTMTVGAGMEQPLDAKHQSHEIRQRGMSHRRAPEEDKVCSQHCIRFESCDGLFDVCSKVSFLSVPF